MSKKRACSAAFAVWATLSVVSCTSGTDSAGGEPPVAAPPIIRTAAEIVLPLDAYQQSLRDYTRTQRAAWLLTRDCVRRFGGDYTLPESAVLSSLPRFENQNDRRYGIFDSAQAASQGYRVPETGGAEDQRRWNPSPTELLLVRGAADGQAPTDAGGKVLPEGGCSGEATRALEEGAPPPANDKLGAELSVQTHKRSETDSRVRQVMGRWSECMSRVGHSYRSVWEPNDRTWPAAVGDAEISTATADVACKQETNLVGVWFAVESAYQTRLIEQNAEPLAVVKAHVEAQTRNAARVVGG